MTRMRPDYPVSCAGHAGQLYWYQRAPAVQDRTYQTDHGTATFHVEQGRAQLLIGVLGDEEAIEHPPLDLVAAIEADERREASKRGAAA